MRVILTFALALGLLPGLSAQSGAEPCHAIVGGTVHTMDGPVLHDGVVVTRGKKIVAVGSREEVEIPKDAEVISAAGMIVTPGFVELHNHTAASDLNDTVYQINPEMRVLDNIRVKTPEMRIAVAGGITTMLTIPGSGTNMSGWGVITKTWGETPADVLVRFPGALKIAQAGNPERGAGDLGSGRMGMNWLIRNVLAEGLAYHRTWTKWEKTKKGPPPEKVLRYEYLRGLFRREYPIAVHTQQMQVVQSTMRILVDEYKLDVVVDHGTFDGYLNAPEMQRRDLPIANGPRQVFFDRRQNKVVGNAAAWHWLGIDADSLTVNTDAPVIPQEELPFQGAMAIRYGLPHEVCLRGCTINGARMLHIDDRVGSLTPGKDADVVIWTGDPFDPRHRTQVVLVNGEVAYDAARDGIRW